MIVERCCGLDVHQETVVACLLIGASGDPTDEGGAHVPYGDARPRSLARLARGGGGDASAWKAPVSTGGRSMPYWKDIST